MNAAGQRQRSAAHKYRIRIFNLTFYRICGMSAVNTPSLPRALIETSQLKKASLKRAPLESMMRTYNPNDPRL
ncbi:MAG: hypothetical protein AAGF19_06550, partial [Pseudomonadota bacterium]